MVISSLSPFWAFRLPVSTAMVGQGWCLPITLLPPFVLRMALLIKSKVGWSLPNPPGGLS